MAQLRRRGGPEPERAVDVKPRAGSLDRIGDRVQVVERAGVDLAELRAHDGRARLAGELLAECVGDHAALRVSGHEPDRVGSEPEEADGAVDRAVALGSGDHADRRRSGEAVCLGVVAGSLEHVVARGGKRRPVRHLAARHERERRLLGNPEQLLQPAPGDLFDDRGGRGRQGEPGVLVPDGREPVRRERDRERAADHEAEVAPARHLGQPRLGVAGERLDHLERVGRPFGKRRVEGLAQLVDRRLGPDGQVRNGLDVRDSELRGALQQPAIIHGSSLCQGVRCSR